MPENLVLIGFSGSGKSSVGQILAARLGWPFVDTDRLIVERFGMAVADLFRQRGEAVFRAAEREAVAAACAESRQVISLGGGATVDPTNRRLVADGNLIVRLDARPETILQRLRAHGNAEERPLLAGADPLQRIQALLAARQEAYAIAEVAIDTDGCSPEDAAKAVLAALPSRWRPSRPVIGGSGLAPSPERSEGQCPE